MAVKTKKANEQAKATRTMRFLWRSEDGIFSISNLTNGSGSADYLVQQVAKSVFLLRKLITNAIAEYVVCIGDQPNCGCKAFEGKGTCKHVEALLAKRKAGEV